MTPELPNEGPETARILHELAGVLTSVLGFAQLLERRPDHPRASEFLGMVSGEAERAVEALRDLQLLRALRAAVPVEQVEPVAVADLVADVTTRATVAEAAAVGAPAGATVLCDRELAVDLMARSVAAARKKGHDAVRFGHDEDGLVMTVMLGTRAEADDLSAGIDGFFPEVRPVAVARYLFERWGGTVELATVDDACELRMHLRSA